MIIVDVVTKSKKWQEVGDSVVGDIENICVDLILLTEIKTILKKNFILEVSISLASNLQMKKVNFKFRQKNQATNVLSFPACDEKLIRKFGIKTIAKGLNHLFLGDIILAYETIKKEAKEQKKVFDHHLTHLILHSILHLIGYDHVSSKAAKVMEDLEIEILQKFNIRNPYLQKI